MSSSTTLSPILSSSSSSSSSQNQTPKIQLLNLDSLSVQTPTYTSLRDVLPYSGAAVNSPAANHYHVPIRNRLVKQAAWAYLQPMSTSPSGGPSGPNFFRRNPLATCLSFIYHHILPSLTRTLHRILHIFPCFLPVILWYHNNFYYYTHFFSLNIQKLTFLLIANVYIIYYIRAYVYIYISVNDSSGNRKRSLVFSFSGDWVCEDYDAVITVVFVDVDVSGFLGFEGFVVVAENLSLWVWRVPARFCPSRSQARRRRGGLRRRQWRFVGPAVVGIRIWKR